MRKHYLLCLAVAMVTPFAVSYAQEFPTAPPNLKEMEAKGLPRLSADDLKAYFPGVIDSKATKGRHIITHNPDGTCLRKAVKHGLKDTSGTWRIDDKQNIYCRAMPKQAKNVMASGGLDENCFAVFRDPDGIHFYDYDIQDGFYAHTWRKAKE